MWSVECGCGVWSVGGRLRRDTTEDAPNHFPHRWLPHQAQAGCSGFFVFCAAGILSSARSARTLPTLLRLAADRGASPAGTSRGIDKGAGSAFGSTLGPAKKTKAIRACRTSSWTRQRCRNECFSLRLGPPRGTRGQDRPACAGKGAAADVLKSWPPCRSQRRHKMKSDDFSRGAKRPGGRRRRQKSSDLIL